MAELIRRLGDPEFVHRLGDLLFDVGLFCMSGWVLYDEVTEFLASRKAKGGLGNG